MFLPVLTSFHLGGEGTGWVAGPVQVRVRRDSMYGLLWGGRKRLSQKTTETLSWMEAKSHIHWEFPPDPFAQGGPEVRMFPPGSWSAERRARSGKKGLHRMAEDLGRQGWGPESLHQLFPVGTMAGGGGRSYLLTKIVSKEQGRVSNCLSRWGLLPTSACLSFAHKAPEGTISPSPVTAWKQGLQAPA